MPYLLIMSTDSPDNFDPIYGISIGVVCASFNPHLCEVLKRVTNLSSGRRDAKELLTSEFLVLMKCLLVLILFYRTHILIAS